MKEIINKIIQTNKMSVNDMLTSTKFVYTPLNPVSYLEARKNKELFQKLDGIWVDGFILTLFIRWFYGTKVRRTTFDITSLAPDLFQYASENNKTVYCVGAKEQEIAKALSIINHSYPNLKIIGYRNGYFNTNSDFDAEFRKITLENPDYLIVGMGIVKQEDFLIRIKEFGFQGIGYTCGAFFHQTALDESKTDYYPAWIDKYNLRFVYRFYKEKHTRKRYLKAFFVFPILFLKDRLS